jgi:hypothetical protein
MAAHTRGGLLNPPSPVSIMCPLGPAVNPHREGTATGAQLGPATSQVPSGSRAPFSRRPIARGYVP